MSAVRSSAGISWLIRMGRIGTDDGGPAAREPAPGARGTELAVTKQEVVHPGRPGESSGCQVIHPGQEAWMNIHQNAPLTLRRRQELVLRLEAGEPLKPLARVFAVSPRTARKWRARYQADGWAGLADRWSRPHTSPRVTAPRLQLAAKALPRQQSSCAQIASEVELTAA